MSIRKLKNVLIIILLALLAGCTSDDHEGTFNDPTNNTSIVGNNTSGTGLVTDVGLNDRDTNIIGNGYAAGFHVISPATMFAIDGAGLVLSTTANSFDGSFDFGEQTLNGNYVLFLVPENSSGLNWQGDVQAAIVTVQSSNLVEVTANPRILKTIDSRLAVNPITTAVALSVFQNNNFDLVAFAESISNAGTSEKLTEFNAILASVDLNTTSKALDAIIASWGIDSKNANLFSTSLFDSSSYLPRSTISDQASTNHFFIEILSVKFGKTNLGNSLLNQVTDNLLTNSNLLQDKSFQEGLVFVLYCQTKYKPYNASASELLSQFLSSPLTLEVYAESIQSITNDLLKEFKNSYETEEVILARIKEIIASQEIPYQ